MRSAVALVVALAVGASAGAASPTAANVATLPGDVASWVVEDGRVAWLGNLNRNGFCERSIVWVQTLSSRRRTRLGESDCQYGVSSSLVFDGRRALWERSISGNTSVSHIFSTAAVDDPKPLRVDEWVHLVDYADPDPDPQPLVMAADRGALVYFSECRYGCESHRRPPGVRRLRGRRPIVLAPVPRADALAVSGKTVAIGRRSIRRYSCGCSFAPSWSPDGRSIAFNRGHRSFEIHVVGADGSGLRRLTTNSLDEVSLAWSPDGNKLAAEVRGETPVVYIVDAATGGAGLLGPGAAPAWTPDGSALAVVRRVARRWEIDRVDVATGASSPLLSSSFEIHDVAWAPDGLKLAFATEDGTFVGSTAGRPVRISNAHAASVAWSPSGDRLAVEVVDVEAGERAVLLMRPDGREKSRLPGNGSGAAWSPTGTSIVYVSGRGQGAELFVADLVRGTRRPLLPVRPPESLSLVSLHDLETGRLRARIELPGGITSVALSGSRGLAGLPNAWHLFDARTGRSVRAFARPRGPGTPHLTGRWIVFATAGGAARALDVQTGRMRSLPGVRAKQGIRVDGGFVYWLEPRRTATVLRRVALQ